MKLNLDLKKRLRETTSRQCLAEWEKGVVSETLRLIGRSMHRSFLKRKDLDDRNKVGATKRSLD
jgi:hypothetical protein